MGQGQSSSNDAAANDVPVKQDYYELLGVERTATDEDLKKAYRRKALELHPDRNYGNEEGATKLFADVQAAYEVLSDPQERAWYDSHRDVLLRGERPGEAGAEDYSYNMKLTGADEVLKLMMRFNKNIQYTDSPSGFYGGLHDFFKQLAKEEDIACQWQDLDYPDYPEFGLKDDDYEDIVRPFYSAWAGFATKKSYSWKDQYRLSDAPDRRIRRLMEKENQKLRDDAIAEYNDAVRSLVAFVRKRDPRVQNNQKSEAERQKFLRESAAAQAARMKAKRQQEMDKGGGISAWAESHTKDEHEGGFSSASDIEEHEYDCVVCDKTFKSEKQFQAHEKSKKHIKALKELKREMRKEGKDLDLEPQQEDEETEQAINEVDCVETELNGNLSASPTHERSELTSSPLHSDDEEAHATPQTAVTSNYSAAAEQSDSLSASDDDYAPRTAVVDRVTAEDEVANATTDLSLNDTPQDWGSDTPNSRKINKAKLKRAKKAAKAEYQKQSNTDLACVICNEEFPSRNKLFEHIKLTDHTPAFRNQGPTKGKKSKKKK